MLRCITKSTLRKLNEVVGKLDRDSGQVVTGFVGRLDMSDGLYHGEIHYTEVGDEPPEDVVSIRAILSPDMAAIPANSGNTIIDESDPLDVDEQSSNTEE